MSRRSLWLFLTLALLNGLVYTVLVPPWQHYDEPNHFEYAWLIAYRSHRPQEGDFDRPMRVATLRSMIAHDFFRGMGGVPPVDAEVPWIGPVAQVGNAPLYYWLAALPMRLFAPLDIEPQLYAARLTSLALLLLTVGLAWGTLGVLFPPDSALRWMPLGLLVALPPFVDIMTAVNDDVAGVAAFALFLFFATRLIRRGWRWGDATGLLVALGTCLLAKRTVYFVAALVPLVVLFALLRGAHRRWAWVLTALTLAVGLLFLLRSGDAALWYHRTTQAQPTRAAVPNAPLGRYALRLQVTDRNSRTQILQFLPDNQVPTWAGQTLTLGAWMWASAPIEVAAPHLVLIGQPPLPLLSGTPKVTLSTSPQFYTWTVRLPDAPLRRAWVQFEPSAVAPQTSVDVFIDGAILAQGEYPPDEGPRWGDATGEQAVWGGQPVRNLLRNASGERAWLNPQPWADALWSRVFGYQNENFASLVGYTLRDWPGAGWYYQLASSTLFRSFWGKFGWGHVSLLGHKPYRALAIVSALLLIGALLTVRRDLSWEVALLFALAVAASWGLALARGAHHTLSAWVNIPVARYTFSTLLPLAIGFAAGAWYWERLLARFLPALRRWPGLLWGLFLLGLTLWGWASVYAFYYV